MRILFFTAIVFLIASCSTDMNNRDATLQEALSDTDIVRDNVIACAASNENDDLVSVFFYPRDGASNFQYYETSGIDVDKNDFDNYFGLELATTDVFNGYLKKFEIALSEEKWVIVSFEEAGKIHLSNPIRIKHMTKPTEYLPEAVTVEQEIEGMPKFTWNDGSYTDTAIYFQVVSRQNGDLLSGTYTYDKAFQFYDTQNVVLNITKGSPSALKVNTSYGFTMLAVSEDNWVNQLSEINFEAK